MGMKKRIKRSLRSRRSDKIAALCGYRPRGQSGNSVCGSVLILTLWVITFLSILALVAGNMIRQEILVMKKMEGRARHYDISRSGTIMAIEAIKSYYENRDVSKADTLNGYWADNPGLFKDKHILGSTYSIQNEYTSDITGKRMKRFGLVDEERKININRAGAGNLKRLLVKAGGMDEINAARLAKNIVDWRDPDDTKWGENAGFSERVYYKNAKTSHVPRNLPFKAVEEVLLVKEMEMPVFAKVRDKITVYGSGRININTASGAVLYAAGMSDSLVAKILVYRSGMDRIAGTQDDNIFAKTDDIAKVIAANFPVEIREKEELTEVLIANILDVTSFTFESICITNMGSGGLQTALVCIFDKKGKIEYWGNGYFTA